MKKYCMILALSALSLAGTAQQIRYGAKAGLNLANFSGDIEDNKMKLGIHLGGFAKIAVTDAISVQPELVLSSQGAKEKSSYEGITFESKTKLTYINIPLLAQYNTTSGFYGETGPQFGFLVSAKAKSDEGKQNIKEHMKTLDVSWAFGVGYLLPSNIGVNARFNLGLSNIAKGEQVEGAKVKNSVIQVGVFYVLGEK
ncbi:porin family protein [Paraflavitalea sp. CAU 1676]|uniref:porin family protein n=1 Tax=Paraflavitalea sp. CAU 1676 TaxID=3032598 RepID=UPI0023DCEA5A|nr:porin family protein [Paraflavitalea sp. CAU 1676]MDF2191956.1 porin family protein [Paraflavitalea sp. CAU 1676]